MSYLFYVYRFILTKWYVKKRAATAMRKYGIGFILTKWYVKFIYYTIL
nr:hypothetical protein [Clostridioides difficile]